MKKIDETVGTGHFCSAIARVALLVLSGLISVGTLRAEAQPHLPRPRVALVLEGGGALGFAHVGVIKVLDEARVPVDFVTGTSMGSIVGAAFASGCTTEELERVLSTTDWDKLFNETPPRDMVSYRQKAGRESEIYGDAKIGFEKGDFVVPTAMVQGQYVELLFQTLFSKVPSEVNFDELPIPYRAVAADVETGEAVILGQGSLALAARASMSVPGFFAPVDLDGRLLVDGGITNNYPVDVALARNPQVIIGVEFGHKFRKRDELNGPLAISAQILDLLLEHTSRTGAGLMRKQDLTIRPILEGYSSTSFNDAKAIMLAGERAAREALPALRKWAVPEAEFNRYLARRTELAPFRPTIQYLRFDKVAPIHERSIRRALSLEPGEVFDPAKIEAALGQAYQTGELRKISYTVEERDGQHGLVIRTEQKEWLRQYGRLGFAIQDDFDGDSGYSLGTEFRITDPTTAGSYVEVELEIGTPARAFAELYQPIMPGSPFFVAPSIELSRTNLSLLKDGEYIAEYNRTAAVLGLNSGISFEQYGELTAGLRRGQGELDRRVGEPTIPDFDYDIGEFVSALQIDQYDNPDFPTTGYRASIVNTLSRESLGADGDFEQTRGLLGAAVLTYGANTLLMNGEVGVSSDGLPVERSYALGGAFDISGFKKSSLVADNYWVARSILFRRIAKGSSALIPLGGYLGGTVEFASLRTEIESVGDHDGLVSGSIFIGADTPLLPVYLGFGMSNDSEQSVFLNIGRLSPRRR